MKCLRMAFTIAVICVFDFSINTDSKAETKKTLTYSFWISTPFSTENTVPSLLRLKIKHVPIISAKNNAQRSMNKRIEPFRKHIERLKKTASRRPHCNFSFGNIVIVLMVGHTFFPNLNLISTALLCSV